MTKSDTRKDRRIFRGLRKKLRVLLHGNWPDMDLLDAVIDAASSRDWHIMAKHFFADDEQVRKWGPDGVLTYDRLTEAERERVQGYGCPVVLCGFDWPPGASGPHVTEDSEQVGRVAAEHFLERGFRTVGFVVQQHSGWEGSRDESAYLGFKQVAECGGATCLPPQFRPHMEPAKASGASRAAAWLETLPRPVGLLVWRDILAGHVCAACWQNGVAVPEEVAILGIGNRRRACTIAPCRLSSVDPDPVRHGRETVKRLGALMQGRSPGDNVVLIPPLGVVARKSTDIQAVEDLGVARALTFMWEHFDEPLTVGDIATGAGVPLRTLYRHFNAQVGRTITQEILRKRLERCRELLLTTDLTVTEITPQLGFLSTNYLHRAFRKKFGMSPREFRLKHQG